MALLAALLLLFRLGARSAGARPAARADRARRVAAGASSCRPATRSPRTSLEPEPVEIADPCKDRERSSVGGVEGVVEGIALRGLDRAACRFGSSREELVLALFDDQSRRDYEREHGVDPRQLDQLLKGIVGL